MSGDEFYDDDVTSGIVDPIKPVDHDHAIFRRDMRRNLSRTSYEVETYEPRAFDKRPAVRVDNDLGLQEVIRATTVVLTWDQLGSGLIVYPVVRAPEETR